MNKTENVEEFWMNFEWREEQIKIWKEKIKYISLKTCASYSNKVRERERYIDLEIERGYKLKLKIFVVWEVVMCGILFCFHFVSWFS